MAHSIDKQRTMREDLCKTRAAQAVIDFQALGKNSPIDFQPGKNSPIDTIIEVKQLLEMNQSLGKTPNTLNTNPNIEKVNGPTYKR